MILYTNYIKTTEIIPILIKYILYLNILILKYIYFKFLGLYNAFPGSNFCLSKILIF